MRWATCGLPEEAMHPFDHSLPAYLVDPTGLCHLALPLSDCMTL